MLLLFTEISAFLRNLAGGKYLCITAYGVKYFFSEEYKLPSNCNEAYTVWGKDEHFGFVDYIIACGNVFLIHFCQKSIQVMMNKCIKNINKL